MKGTFSSSDGWWCRAEWEHGTGQSGDGGVGDGVEMCILVGEGQVLGFLCFSRSTKQSRKGNFQTSNF